MIFSEVFGNNGGRRLLDHLASHTDCAYYIMANELHMRRAH